MRSRGRRLLAGVLCLVLILCALPVLPLSAAGDAERVIQERVASAVERWETEVDISDLRVDVDTAMNACWDLLSVDPRYSFVRLSLCYSNADGWATRLQLQYSATPAEAEQMLAQLNAVIADVMRGVWPEMSDVEKALAVHEYFVSHFAYDETYQNGTAADILLEKTGVCQAYAEAYAFFMHLLEIPCVVVPSAEMNHAWNMIEIDGDWYHVDTTWDDPLPDLPGQSQRTFFLLSDAAISSRSPQHYGWYSEVQATNTQYDDAFWSDGRQPMLYQDGLWYYMTDEGICSYRFSDGAGQLVLPLDFTWPVWGEPGSRWGGNFSGFAIVGDRLYYSGPTAIYSARLDGSDLREECRPDTSQGYIYGFVAEGTTLKYYIQTMPLVSVGERTWGSYEITGTTPVPGSGDVNGDGRVNSSDARLVLQFTVSLAVLNGAQQEAADLDANGAVNSSDARAILQRAVA